MVRGLPEAAMDRLMRRAGAQRVSDDARKLLRDFLERRGLEIGQLAKLFAEHAKRNTVKKDDILLAIKQTESGKKAL